MPSVPPPLTFDICDQSKRAPPQAPLNWFGHYHVIDTTCGSRDMFHLPRGHICSLTSSHLARCTPKVKGQRSKVKVSDPTTTRLALFISSPLAQSLCALSFCFHLDCLDFTNSLFSFLYSSSQHYPNVSPCHPWCFRGLCSTTGASPRLPRASRVQSVPTPYTKGQFLGHGRTHHLRKFTSSFSLPLPAHTDSRPSQADAPTMLTFAILMHLLLLFYSVGIVEMGPETYMGIQLILLAFMLRRSIETAEDVYKAYKYEVPSPTCECRGCQWRSRD